MYIGKKKIWPVLMHHSTKVALPNMVIFIYLLILMIGLGKYTLEIGDNNTINSW